MMISKHFKVNPLICIEKTSLVHKLQFELYHENYTLCDIVYCGKALDMVYLLIKLQPEGLAVTSDC